MSAVFDSFRNSGDPHRLALSVDIEDWYHCPAVTGSPFSAYDTVTDFFEDWSGKYDYLTRPTYRTLELLNEHGLTATFFVVADVVEDYPGLVEEIAARGHEIGCHGLHHACAIHPDTKEPRFSRREYRDRLERAKALLEDASGQRVRGYRAPNAYVGGWMLDVLEEVGFEYDSSVAMNTLYNKTDQELNDLGTSPYVPKRGTLSPGGDREFVELPWPNYDLSAVKLPAAGGPTIRFLGRRLVQAGVQQSLREGHTVFYFHPLDIARESLPNVGNARRRPAYWAFTGKTTERRIRTLLESVSASSITTCGEIAYEYLADRQEVTFESHD